MLETDPRELVLTLSGKGTVPVPPIVLITSLEHPVIVSLLPPEVGATVGKPVREDPLLRACLRVLGLERVTAASLPVGRTNEVGQDGAEQAEPVRILVAEDNPVNQRVVQLQLKKAGYTATLVTNGAEALQKLDRENFDIVLMDCQMPVLDGYEATRRLRRDDRFRELQIIAMTANSMEGDREKCLAAGMNDYLAKPTREADLREALQRAVQARRASLIVS
jgi:two-component system, sensor histidine kinase and response regulator